MVLHDDYRVRCAAMNLCNGQEVPFGTIWKGLSDDFYEVRCAALKSCEGRKVPAEIVNCGLRDGDWRVRAVAASLLMCCDASPYTIELALRDPDNEVRQSAIKACKGIDISLDSIERWLHSENDNLRFSVLEVCKINKRSIPVIRTVEPPYRVYEKCLDNVIVVAFIPKDAQVRGRFDMQCRSNKAVIVDVIGEIAGINIGISRHDMETIYRSGDIVEFEDFDLKNTERSNGFHFFCTYEQAKRYWV